jgi:hypothetical protein
MLYVVLTMPTLNKAYLFIYLWCLHVSAACVIWLVENKNDSKFKHEYTNDKMAFIGTSWPKN